MLRIFWIKSVSNPNCIKPVLALTNFVEHYSNENSIVYIFKMLSNSPKRIISSNNCYMKPTFSFLRGNPNTVFQKYIVGMRPYSK